MNWSGGEGGRCLLFNYTDAWLCGILGKPTEGAARASRFRTCDPDLRPRLATETCDRHETIRPPSAAVPARGNGSRPDRRHAAARWRRQAAQRRGRNTRAWDGGHHQDQAADETTEPLPRSLVERRLHPDGIRGARAGALLQQGPGGGDANHASRASSRDRGVRHLHLRDRRDQGDAGHGLRPQAPAPSAMRDGEKVEATYMIKAKAKTKTMAKTTAAARRGPTTGARRAPGSQPEDMRT